jgi:hypothetical protein
MGVWTNNNAIAEGKYIDPQDDPISSDVALPNYFGWLVPSQPLH